jgi:hypothetical protein
VLDISLAPLALETQTFNAGDTVRISVSFQYRVGLDTELRLMAAPFYSNLFGNHVVDSCLGQSDIFLEASPEEAEKTAAVDMLLVPKASGGIENGTYGLVVWIRPQNSQAGPWSLPGPLARAEQDSVMVVTGNSIGGSSTLSAMMPALMMVMMLGMVGPMISGGEE